MRQLKKKEERKRFNNGAFKTHVKGTKKAQIRNQKKPQSRLNTEINKFGQQKQTKA